MTDLSLHCGHISEGKYVALFFRHFMQADANKFSDVWCMNEEECKELIMAVLEGDRIIHTQQLGLEWQQPDL